MKTVSSKKELERAIKNKDDSIIVEGALAKDIIRIKGLSKLSVPAMGIMIATFGLSPITGGISAAVAAPVAASVGAEVSVIIIAASIGLGLLVGIFKDYDIVELKTGTVSLRLERKG